MVEYRNLIYLISIDVAGDQLTISFPINQNNKLAIKCAGFQIFTHFFVVWLNDTNYIIYFNRYSNIQLA